LDSEVSEELLAVQSEAQHLDEAIIKAEKSGDRIWVHQLVQARENNKKARSSYGWGLPWNPLKDDHILDVAEDFNDCFQFVRDLLKMRKCGSPCITRPELLYLENDFMKKRIPALYQKMDVTLRKPRRRSPSRRRNNQKEEVADFNQEWKKAVAYLENDMVSALKTREQES